MIVGLVFLSVVLVSMIAVLAARSVPAGEDVAWLAGPSFSLADSRADSDAVAVCRRYLTRHRRHRLAGGLFGVAFAAIVGVRWFGSVTIGMGQGSPLADLLFCGVSGVIIGSLSAESFRLTATGGTRRAASLVPRQVSAARSYATFPWLLAALALATGVVAGFTGHGWRAFVTSLILVVPLGVAELVLRAIVGRSQPAMTDRTRYLDARLRTFAGTSVSFLHRAAAALMLGWTVTKVEGISGLLAFIRFGVALGCLAVALVMVRRASPGPSGGVMFDDGVLVG